MTIEDMLYVYRNILKLTSGAEFDGLRRSQDHDGNTPLHLALKINNFAAAKFLLLWCIESEARQEMNIIDNNGHSVSNLLESLAADDTPYVVSTPLHCPPGPFQHNNYPLSISI